MSDRCQSVTRILNLHLYDWTILELSESPFRQDRGLRKSAFMRAQPRLL